MSVQVKKAFFPYLKTLLFNDGLLSKSKRKIFAKYLLYKLPMSSSFRTFTIILKKKAFDKKRMGVGIGVDGGETFVGNFGEEKVEKK